MDICSTCLCFLGRSSTCQTNMCLCATVLSKISSFDSNMSSWKSDFACTRSMFPKIRPQQTCEAPLPASGARPASFCMFLCLRSFLRNLLIDSAGAFFASARRLAKPRSQVSLWSVCFLFSLAISHIRLQDLLQSLQFHCSSADSLNHVSFAFQFKNDFGPCSPFSFEKSPFPETPCTPGSGLMIDSSICHLQRF